MRVRYVKSFAVILLIFALMFGTAIHASADMGPKPSIKLTVKNAPGELYVIDLLKSGSVHDLNDPKTKSALERLGGNERELAVKLTEYVNDDGMTARMGSIIGDVYTFSKSTGKYTFDYDNVPKEFRVIIITEGGQVFVSEKCTRRAYNADVTFDMAAGTLREDKMSIAAPHIVRFTVTFLFTLFIEWVVLLCFKYRLRDGKNGQVFLLTNLCTQLFLYVLLNFIGGFMWLIEILITAVEAFVYSRTLTPKEPKRADNYAITANAASAILGIPVWVIVYFIIR